MPNPENTLKAPEIKKRPPPPQPTSVNPTPLLESEPPLHPTTSSRALWGFGFHTQADEEELQRDGQPCLGDSPGTA